MSTPASTGRSLSMRAQKEWMVPMKHLSRPARARSQQSPCRGHQLGGKSFQLDLKSGSAISARPFRVNVTAARVSTEHFPEASKFTILPIMAVVLPVPAAASTRMVRSNSWRIMLSWVLVRRIQVLTSHFASAPHELKIDVIDILQLQLRASLLMPNPCRLEGNHRICSPPWNSPWR